MVGKVKAHANMAIVYRKFSSPRLNLKVKKLINNMDS